MPWNAIQQFNNPNTCWNVWKTFFTDTLNRHAPIQHKRIRRNSVPWSTPRIKALMRNRDYHKNNDNVVSSLRGLKANKTTGLDKIPPKILKISARIVAPFLTYILTLSLATGIYIDDWKRARVTPIFKSGDRRQCANYRPISILSAVRKVFEKEVFRQVYGYLTENCMLSKFQSGVRPKHCTVTALIQMCDEMYQALCSCRYARKDL